MFEISSGKIKSALKTVVYGPEGIGKTTFASQFLDPLFIDTEGSTKHMDVKRLPTPSSWMMLMQEIQHVRDTPKLCKTLVIDTADWAEQLCINKICADKQIKGIEDIGYGKGYVYLAEDFGRLLNLLEEVVQKGINVVITAHAQMRKFEQPDELGSYDRWELKLQKKTAPMVKEWADMVLFANYQTIVVNVDGQGATKGKNKAQGGRRVMYTSHHPCWDAKNRFNLPSEMDFNYEGIKAIFADTQSVAPVQPVSVQQPIQQAPVLDIKPTVENAQMDTEPLNTVNDIYAGIPKSLIDLMKQSNVNPLEVQEAVAIKGYYPKDTPIRNYDPNFIESVLVAAWTQVCDLIKKEVLPF